MPGRSFVAGFLMARSLSRPGITNSPFGLRSSFLMSSVRPSKTRPTLFLSSSVYSAISAMTCAFVKRFADISASSCRLRPTKSCCPLDRQRRRRRCVEALRAAFQRPWRLRRKTTSTPDFALRKGKTADFVISSRSRSVATAAPTPHAGAACRRLTGRNFAALTGSCAPPFDAIESPLAASASPTFDPPGHAGRSAPRCSAAAQRRSVSRAHAPVLRRRLVVPAEEVQEAVGEEHRQLRHQVAPAGLGLAARGRDADDDVAEQPVCRSPSSPSCCENARTSVGRFFFR